MKMRFTLMLIMIPFLAINLPASTQNKTDKTPQENTDSHESIRSLLRQKHQKSPRRKVERPKSRAPKQVSPTSKEGAGKPKFHDYPLLREKDEKAPVDKRQ